jgi:hypothetical protein
MKQTTNIASDAAQGAVPSFTPIQLAHRSDGWTPDRQRAFIEELADCGVIAEAAARVGMTEQTARRLRRRPDAAAFNKAWDAAIQLGGDRLRSIAYERAVNGTVRQRYYRGEVVGEERVYDNRLLIYLPASSPSPAAACCTARIGTACWTPWRTDSTDPCRRPINRNGRRCGETSTGSGSPASPHRRASPVSNGASMAMTITAAS